MISEPRKYAYRFVQAGADHITFHIETVWRPREFLQELRDSGVTAGVALNPETAVKEVATVAPSCDLVLVMTVSPGFGGQDFMPQMVKKVRQVRDLVGPDIRVQVDGGISPETVAQVVGGGADTLVAGSAIFGQHNRRAAIDSIHQAIMTAECSRLMA
jgi:ribulose-phosphate 3-epimerase